MNDRCAIISSRNLYEFSLVNNNEMGLLIDRTLNCPFIVHRLPARRIPFDGQEHHGQVQGDYLGKTFQKVRDQIPVFKEM